jgi:hypothetical protein
MEAWGFAVSEVKIKEEFTAETQSAQRKPGECMAL